MQDFRELRVWQKSHGLVLKVYKIVANFPSDEKFGLSSQLKRAAASIPTNISEGCGYDSQLQLGKFLSIALGSACEADYLIQLAKDLGLIQEKQHEDLCLELISIKKMLYALKEKVGGD